MAKLERVFGTTACSSSLSVDPISGLVAYPAGSIVVVLNPRTLSQAHLICASKNQLTSLAFSPNGRYIVTGEFGAEPKVRVWEIRHENNTRGEHCVELAYHRLGISCVCFTKDSDQVISVGNQHDKSVCVWDWRTRSKLAESRLTCQVNAMDVSESGRMFVTVGVRHVKFWYLENNANGDNNSGVLLLHGRSAILADQRNNTFVDVCCASNNRTFSITISKLLVEFVDKKLINLYELGGEVPFSLSIGAPHQLFMGFGNGAIRVMNLQRMEPELELCRPHTLHCDICSVDDGTDAEDSRKKKYPDVHSIVFHAPSKVLTALYSDRSVYHWSVQQSSSKMQSFKISSQLFHVGPVFDIEVSKSQPQLFFTAGADETVRIWCMNNTNTTPSTTLAITTTTTMVSVNGTELVPSSASTSPSPPVQCIVPPNHFSLELRKILYLSPGIDTLSEQPDKNFGGIMSDTLDSTTGVRCIKLSTVGSHLACGTRNGNICVFDLNDRDMVKLVELEAHDGEVLCLEYCVPSSATGGLHLLASGSRDRLIHLFDVDQLYVHLLTIDDHSSSISALKFNILNQNLFQLFTFGTDKLVVVRQLMFTNSNSSSSSNSSPSSTTATTQLSSRRLSQIVSNNGPNCMTVTRDGNVLVGCQDRQLRMYNETGKLLKTVKGTVCEEGTITKLCLDPSESFAATICSDRFVYIMDLCNGECVAVLNGQSDSVTGISFSSNCKRLLLVSYSGCILVWHLSVNLTKRMLTKLAQIQHETGNRSTTPDSLVSEDSAQQHQSDEFGSLTSLNICQQTASSSVATTSTEVTLRQEDDELDSGIGGRSSGGRRAELDAHQQRSTFELKRVVPADAIIRRRLSGGEAQEPLTGLPPLASPPPASVSPMQQLYPPQNAAVVTPNRQTHHAHGVAPPPYRAVPFSNNNVMAINNTHIHQNGGGVVGGANSRSMSNLNYVRQTPQQQQQQQQRNAISTGRRRWNNNVSSSFVTSAGFSGGGSQQQQQQGAGMAFGNQAQSSNFVSSPSNTNLNPTTSFHSHNQQISSVYNNNSPLHPQPTAYQYQPQQQFSHHGQQLRMSQHQLGGLSMSTSVSLNALRTMLTDDGSGRIGGEVVVPQQILNVAAPQSMYDAPPSPIPTSSMENSPVDNGLVRNSLSRRYYQNGTSASKTPSSATVWCPSAKSAASTKHRSSNLFNTSGTSVFSSALSDRNNKTAAPTTSSSSTGTTPTGELFEGLATTNGAGGHNGRRYQPKTPYSQGSSSPEPPSHKGRMAMSKLKQRRLSTAREDPSSLDGANPFRSRSQSPTHLAIQTLSALATSNQHASPVKPPSSLRDGMSRISSSPSSASRSQQRRLSSVNASRLHEARERLKKSQENLAALGSNGGHAEDVPDEEMMTDGSCGTSRMARSKSIGNLMRTNVARNGPFSSSRRSSATAATLSEQQRQMAKSVTDLDDGGAEHLGEEIIGRYHQQENEMTMSTIGGSRLAQLSASRQRLAQSIRDMRLISNSDLTEPSQYHQKQQQMHHEQQQMTSLDLANSSVDSAQQKQNTSGYYSPKGITAMRRGVQKKIDRTTTNKLLGTADPQLSRRTSALGNGQPQEGRLRSISSVAASHRSNYMAQKLARPRSGLNSARSPSSAHGVLYQHAKQQPQHQLDSARSLSIELASVTNSLSNAVQMASTGSTKKMAMHASECIQEMTRACDKLIGTRQLINSDLDISAEERRLLLTGVNRAISAFHQRLQSILVHPGSVNDDDDGVRIEGGETSTSAAHVGKWGGEENGLRV